MKIKTTKTRRVEDELAGENEVLDVSASLSTDGTSVVVSGLEEEIGELVALKQEIDERAVRVREIEAVVRDEADRAMVGAKAQGFAAVRAVRLLGDGGVGVRVGRVDVAKVSNRLVLKEQYLGVLHAMGLLDELGSFVEKTRKIVLSGAWVDWFDRMRTQWRASGSDFPEKGIDDKVEERFGVEAYGKLLEIEQDRERPEEVRSAAREVRQRLTKSAALTVK